MLLDGVRIAITAYIFSLYDETTMHVAYLWFAVRHTVSGTFFIRTAKWKITVDDRVRKTAQHYQLRLWNKNHTSSARYGANYRRTNEYVHQYTEINNHSLSHWQVAGITQPIIPTAHDSRNWTVHAKQSKAKLSWYQRTISRNPSAHHINKTIIMLIKLVISNCIDKTFIHFFVHLFAQHITCLKTH